MKLAEDIAILNRADKQHHTLPIQEHCIIGVGNEIDDSKFLGRVSSPDSKTRWHFNRLLPNSLRKFGYSSNLGFDLDDDCVSLPVIFKSKKYF